MVTDKQGNVLAGATREAADHFDDAVRAFNLFRGDPVAFVNAAIDAAPDCTMAHALKAHLYATATDTGAMQGAARIVAQLKASKLDERTASHVAALEHMVAGEWTAAGIALDVHNARFPYDLVALQAGHLVDFNRANARNLRDRIARVLPRWNEDRPGYSMLLGMHAFGLEEAGDYSRAEATGREAIAREPLDCWAHHAVAHVMEMQGRAEDGLGWMIAREPFWSGDDNFFQCHNWWHKALFHLELGQGGQALVLYDERIVPGDEAVVLDLIDASALLWRLHVLGHDVGDRWNGLAAAWDGATDGRTYPFNDWHAVMAYLGAERMADVERLLDACRGANADGETASWARTIAVPLIEGFRAFWTADYDTAIQRLHGARFIANSFGGSHAQRDVIDWTLVEAAARGRQRAVAEALINERMAQKPHSAVNRRWLESTRT